MKQVILTSPSKINLFLEVLGRRDDGYHEICSIVALTELCDTITLERCTSGITIRVGDPKVPSGPDNLCYRAADLLLRHSGVHGGVSIRIEKHIPVAGGMGGGSSNAAATLWGLNLLYDLGWPREELTGLGSELGSDVPLFFCRGAAFIRGRGERVEELAALTPRWLVIANPGMEISTASVYRRLRLPLTSETAGFTMRDLVEAGQIEAALSHCFNRLEDVVLEAYPPVASLKQRLLLLGASPVLVSGSGPTVFGIMREADAAKRVASSLVESGIAAVACRTLERNPLFATER
ncbi:MAG: 4-(cytidine 5'-diphospho)-2-C-methyl-D-erythritol kinase [Candidatus Methylomirabilota bacterium]|nr:MAG: 4-(cytidine 5'-diphospho)-2-C-methyl-D-erythritol kinase [candidate division NC10 bacterium]